MAQKTFMSYLETSNYIMKNNETILKQNKENLPWRSNVTSVSDIKRSVVMSPGSVVLESFMGAAILVHAIQLP